MSLDIWLYVQVDTGVSLVEIDISDRDGYDFNITHNVSKMWKKAGVFDALYESSGEQAGKYIDALERGLDDMRKNPEAYKELNPPNGWGDYSGALKFLEAWTSHCKRHPKAKIYVFR